MAYTLEQLKQMGSIDATNAQPVSSSQQGYTLQQLKQMGSSDIPSPVAQPLNTINDSFKQGFGAAASIPGNIASDLSQREQNIDKAVNNPDQHPVSKLFQTVGQIFGGAGDIIKEGVSPVVQGVINPISNIKAVQNSATEGVGKSVLDFTNTISNAYKAFKEKHPEIAGNLEAGGNIAQFLPLEKLTGALDTGVSKIVNTANNAVDTTKNAMNNVIDSTKTPPIDIESSIKEAKKNVADTYQRSMPLTPSEIMKEKQNLSRTGDNAFTTYAKYNISPASENAISDLSSLSDKFQEAINIAKENEHALFNVDEIKQNAYKEIERNLSSASERTSAKAKLDTEIKDLKDETPGSFHTGAKGEVLANTDIVERLRQTGNSWAEYNKLNPDSVKNASGRGLANSVRDQVEKQGTFPSYREANREWGKVIHAQEVLKKIQDSGKSFKVIGGLSGSIARKIISGVLGYQTGGVAGIIIAELGSEYTSRLLSNPDLRTYFDRKIIEEFGNTDATPESITKLKDEVKNHIDIQDKLLKLPAPSSIPLGPKSPNESTIQIINAQKNPVSVNPNTGKFQTTYSSDPYLKGQNMVVPNETKTIINSNIINDTIPPDVNKVKDLSQEALKYKSAEEFYNRMSDKSRDLLRSNGIRGQESITKYWEDVTGKNSSDSYQMSHRPTESGAIASDITNNGEFIPKNAYEHPEWYFSMDNTSDYGIATRESFNVIKKIKNKPDAEVVIYRASPNSKLNEGDWVTLSKKYAELHAKDKMKVHSFKVKAKDIQFAGDDINEFGYFPSTTK